MFPVSYYSPRDKVTSLCFRLRSFLSSPITKSSCHSWVTSGQNILSSALKHLSFSYVYHKGMEKAMASHSSTFAWKIPWTEEPGRLQSMGSLESDMTERLHFHFSLTCIGEGNGNPFQCSCLENPRDGEAWWAAISGVTQSRTQLKRLSSSSSSLLSRVFIINRCWILSVFICIYWDNHTIFIFQFVKMVYHIDWFENTEESLHPWSKVLLVMMYDLLNMLLDSVC